MNVVAWKTARALAAHGVPALPAYRRALEYACSASPPPFGKKPYGDVYRRSARDPEWLALSLVLSARGEGKGARDLWDMAACTPDAGVASQIKEHAIDEARHSRGYVTLLDLVFPGVMGGRLRAELQALSPGYTRASRLIARKGSPFAFAATIDELIQMNIAEIRTRFNHLLQMPVLLACCKADRSHRVRRILESLLVDETRHIAYTARLIDRAARESGAERVMDLMRERVRDFNEITDDEVTSRMLCAA